MISRWTLAILLVSVASCEVWTPLCYSRNCLQTITDLTSENFTCVVGFENEFQHFKRRFGVREKYDQPPIGPFQDKPILTFLRLYNHLKAVDSEIAKYNSKDLENITHGLEVDIKIPKGKENNRALYLELSSKGEHGDKDEFYYRFPKKRIFNLSASHTVIIKNHLCLQDIKPWPVSYTLLLTLFQPLMMPQSLVHYISFSKDDLAVALSKFPKENDIHVVFFTPQYMCVKNVFLCNDTDLKICGSYVRKYQGKLSMMSETNICTFFDLLPGVYYIKIEIFCTADMKEDFFFVKSSLLEIPGSTEKDGQISPSDNQVTSNTPFVIIGCLCALILLIVMYIAVKKNVSLILEQRRKESHAEEINMLNQSPDCSTEPRTRSPKFVPDSMTQVSEDCVHERLNASSLNTVSSPSDMFLSTNYDPVPDLTDENEDLRRDFCKLNRLRSNERICPVHGH